MSWLSGMMPQLLLLLRMGESLKFNVGDKVTYVNDYGCEFHDRKITGIMNRKDDESLYCSGRRYYIDSDCPWMPVKESNLRPA